MLNFDQEYKKDIEYVENINKKLNLISIDEYDFDEQYEFDSNLSIEENIARKFILKKKARDLKAKKQYDLAIEHLILLLDNSYFANDYYPYRHLTIKYNVKKQYDKMIEIISSFFKSGIYAHFHQINWFIHKLLYLEEDGYISKNEIELLLDYYNTHGALNKQREHNPIFIADRIFQRRNGEIVLDSQYRYENQEETYNLKEEGIYLEHFKLYDQAIEHYTTIIDMDLKGATNAYLRLAYIFEILGEYENEFEVIGSFYKHKYRLVGNYTKRKFEKRIYNLNRHTRNSFTVNDFILGNFDENNEFKNNSIIKENKKLSNLSNDELLFKYAELYEKGLITREEFDNKKQELL